MSGRTPDPGGMGARRRRSSHRDRRQRDRRSGRPAPALVQQISGDGDPTPLLRPGAVEPVTTRGRRGAAAERGCPRRGGALAHTGSVQAGAGDPRELQLLERGLNELCDEAGRGLHAHGLCRRGSGHRLPRPLAPSGFSPGRQLLAAAEAAGHPGFTPPPCSDEFFLGAQTRLFPTATSVPLHYHTLADSGWWLVPPAALLVVLAHAPPPRPPDLSRALCDGAAGMGPRAHRGVATHEARQRHPQARAGVQVQMGVA
eukprot:COSAG01_NODE_2887_length_6910_cov_1.945236_2_plen_257_part_00